MRISEQRGCSPGESAQISDVEEGLPGPCIIFPDPLTAEICKTLLRDHSTDVTRMLRAAKDEIEEDIEALSDALAWKLRSFVEEDICLEPNPQSLTAKILNYSFNRISFLAIAEVVAASLMLEGDFPDPQAT